MVCTSEARTIFKDLNVWMTLSPRQQSSRSRIAPDLEMGLSRACRDYVVVGVASHIEDRCQDHVD